MLAICIVMFLKKFKNIFAWRKQKMLDEQCFWTSPNGQTFCLANKFKMFDQQCLIVWPGPNIIGGSSGHEKIWALTQFQLLQALPTAKLSRKQKLPEAHRSKPADGSYGLLAKRSNIAFQTFEICIKFACKTKCSTVSLRHKHWSSNIFARDK